MKQIYKELMAVFLNWGSLRMGDRRLILRWCMRR